MAEAIGKPRRAWFDSWTGWGLIPPAADNGTWDEDVLDRVMHVRELAADARPLARRALLLHRDGFPVETRYRRKAVAYVLDHLKRPRHCMARVLWEQRALAAEYRPPRAGASVLLQAEVAQDAWSLVVRTASDTVFDHAFHPAFYAVSTLAAVGGAKALPVDEQLRYEDRLSLFLVLRLLDDDYVRNRVGLGPRLGPR